MEKFPKVGNVMGCFAIAIIGVHEVRVQDGGSSSLLYIYRVRTLCTSSPAQSTVLCPLYPVRPLNRLVIFHEYGV